MRINVNKRNLQEALAKCQIISSKPTMPILGTTLLKTSLNKISIFTTDLETSVLTSIYAEIKEEGEICLPLKKLNEILQEAEEKDPISIEVNDINNVILKQKEYIFKLTGIKSEEFPPFPKIEWREKIELKSEVFKDLVKKISYAAAIGDARFALNGILFSLQAAENRLVAVATDGHRLAINSLDLEEKVNNAKFILPKRLLEDLTRLIKENKKIILEFSSSHAKFSWNDTEIITRLIEDTFPEYESVLPKERKNKWYVNRELLLKGCKRMSVITSDKINMIKFLLSSREGVKIYASVVGIGEGEERISSLYEGEDLEIAFNPYFIIDAIKNLQDEEITLQLGDASSSMLLVSKDKNYTALIMPMRL